MTPTRNIPALRFAEFTDAWEYTKFEELNYSISSGKTKPTDLGNYPVYGSTGIIGTHTNYTHSGTYLLVARVGANAGTINKVNGNFCVTDNTLILDLRDKEIINFIYYNLKEINLSKLIFGSGQPLITGGQLKSLKLRMPTSSIEQQKIADFLSAVDEAIEAETGKLQSLQAHKKGLMQQLFPREGETLPALRFLEFSTAWQEKELGEVIENHGGTSLEQFMSEEGDYHVISIGNYDKYGKYIDNGKRIILNEKSKSKLLNKNDLVMVLNDKTQAGEIIGATILIDESNKYIYNQRSERMICRKDIIPAFAWHNLNSDFFRKKIFSISQGGTQIYINFRSAKELEISLPSLPEQQKIAECLSSLDELLQAQGDKITALKTHKKGLMQQLFPASEETSI